MTPGMTITTTKALLRWFVLLLLISLNNSFLNYPIFKPVHHIFKPVHQIFKPVHQIFKPVHHIFKPVHQIFKPVHQIFKPVHQIFKSVHPILNLSILPFLEIIFLVF